MLRVSRVSHGAARIPQGGRQLLPHDGGEGQAEELPGEFAKGAAEGDPS